MYIKRFIDMQACSRVRLYLRRVSCQACTYACMACIHACQRICKGATNTVMFTYMHTQTDIHACAHWYVHTCMHAICAGTCNMHIHLCMLYLCVCATPLHSNLCVCARIATGHACSLVLDIYTHTIHECERIENICYVMYIFVCDPS